MNPCGTITLRRSVRSKHLRLTVRSDGSAVLSAPLHAKGHQIDHFLHTSKEWLERTRKRMALRPAQVRPAPYPSKRLYRANKETARAVVLHLLDTWNSDGRFKVRTVCIRNQRSRWGSASQRGTLSFNWRIVYLPHELREYLVVHELCHLVHPDHSPRFWALVASFLPDHRARRKAMRRYAI